MSVTVAVARRGALPNSFKSLASVLSVESGKLAVLKGETPA